MDTQLAEILFRMGVQQVSQKKRRTYTAEFKAEAVRLANLGGKSKAALARDLDVPESALCQWIQRAAIEDGKGPPGVLSKAEREELVQLRRENRQLRMEREILKKATAFFAKESP
jgi:transposase